MRTFAQSVRALLARLACASFALLVCSNAVAQYPVKPVKIIVPYGTGGATDMVARQVGAKLQERWGQGVVIENRVGAAGNIGTEFVVKSAADGYTLVMQNSTMTLNPAIFGKAPFDAEKDLTPVMLLGATPKMLVVHPSLNVASLKELIGLARASPGKLTYASCGIGTPQHFAGELFKQMASLDIVHAPYKGCAPAVSDVIAGQVPIAMLTASTALPHFKTGRLKGLAVSVRERYRLAPGVPTFEELGFKPFNVMVWYALMGPAGLPRDVVQKLAADVGAALNDAALQARLSTAGIEEKRGSAAELGALIRQELVENQRLARAAGIKAE